MDGYLELVPFGDQDNDVWEVTSSYVEMFHLPVLGPTATWLGRRLVALQANGMARVRIDDLAGGLGVKPQVLQASLLRLEQFHLGARIGDDVIAGFAVRGRWPWLTHAMVTRLPEYLSTIHDRLRMKEHA